MIILFDFDCDGMEVDEIFIVIFGFRSMAVSFT